MSNTSPTSRPVTTNINPSNPQASAAATPPAVTTTQSESGSPKPPRPLKLDTSDGFATPITSAEARELALSPAQYMAIDLMLQGNTMVAAASSAGVTRRTLYRWLHHDPKFQAAYNSWQLDQSLSARSRLLALQDDAVNTVAASVKTDGRLAFALLKALGTLEKPTPGSTDPEEIEQRMQIEKRQKEAKLKDDDFLASIGGLGLGGKK